MHYSVEAVIARPVEDVFAFCADLRNELRWNPAAVEIEKLTPGAIGLGTRFRARWRNAPSTTVEIDEHSPPGSYATRSRSLGLDVRFGVRLTPVEEGTRYVADVAVHSRGAAFLWGWLAVRMMRRQEPENLRHIKAALEHGTVATSVQAC